MRFDAPRPQRLAAPVTVYVEQFSAHPLEADAAELYAPPDGYLDAAGAFHRQRTSEADRPVYEVVLEPSDGFSWLPYTHRSFATSIYVNPSRFVHPFTICDPTD